MDFGLTAEQEQLADSERSWLTRHDPIVRVRAALDSTPIAIDPEAIRHVTEAGLLDLLTPDMGGTHVDLAVLSEAHGYAASALPLADLAIATWLLDLADAPDTDESAGLSAVARLDHVSGRAAPVPMAADLSGLAVIGDSGDGEYVALVQDVPLTPMTTLDLTRTWARPRLETADLTRIPVPGGTAARVRDSLAVHRALDALGAASRLLEMTVAYAGQREQFGAPIGSFQAVKHHCADMVLRVEAARSTLWAAALALDTESGPRRSSMASAAAAYAKAAASEVAGTALQVHGGIGFTWEHDLHLFLRRIKVDEAVDGTVAEHRLALVAG
jgi:alkylation response protein AidB-like acyl-CoA dehydrogenase